MKLVKEILLGILLVNLGFVVIRGALWCLNSEATPLIFVGVNMVALGIVGMGTIVWRWIKMVV